MLRVIRPEAGECRKSSDLRHEKAERLRLNEVLRPNSQEFFDLVLVVVLAVLARWAKGLE